MKDYADCYTLIFNQDGKILSTMEQTHERAISAVRGMDISKLYIYVFDNPEAYDAIFSTENSGEPLMSQVAKRAVLAAEIDINNTYSK